MEDVLVPDSGVLLLLGAGSDEWYAFGVYAVRSGGFLGALYRAGSHLAAGLSDDTACEYDASVFQYFLPVAHRIWNGEAVRD